MQTNYSGKNSGNLEKHRDDQSEAPQEPPVNDQGGDKILPGPGSSAKDDAAASGGGPTGAEPLEASELELSKGAIAEAEGGVRNEVGAVIDGKYELLSLLGSGGMSSVYKARHAFMRNIVAVKLLHPRLLADTQSLRRFQQEARAARRLKHPNAITVYEFGISGGQPYLVMDYLDGVSCADLVKREGRIDVERCLHIFIQACDALADAHEKGIIHRDLKPSNIMLTKQNDDNCFVKVVDFGIAKIVSEASGESLKLTSTGEVFGSPLYMSPEQCMGQSLDARSDIYSMGCLMYEALTGKTPFIGKNVLETILKQTNEPPPGLGAIDGDVRVVQKLDAIVLKCLAKAPEQRYQTIKELRADLESAAQSAVFGWKALAQIGRKTSEVRRTLARRVGQPRKLTLATIVFSSALAAVAAVIFLLFGPCVGSNVVERELPLAPVIYREVRPPSLSIKSLSDRSWAKLDPASPNSLKDLKKIDEGFRLFAKMGDCYKACGQYSLASLSYQKALTLSEPLQLDSSVLAIEMLNAVAECELRCGGPSQIQTAISSSLQAIERLKKIGRESSSQALVAHGNLGEAYYRAGDVAAAKADYDAVRSLFFSTGIKEVESSILAMILSNAGRFYLEQGDLPNAATMLSHAEGYWSNLNGGADLNLASVLNDRGMVLDRRGEHEEAQKAYQLTNSILASGGTVNNAYRVRVLLNLSDSYFRSGRWVDALRARIIARKTLLGIF